MKNKRKICVVTGTRAEYGLLYMLMKLIKEDDNLQLQIIATCMHYAPKSGMTYKQIETDGFKIDYKLEMLLGNDSAVAISKSMGLATIGFADAFEILKPDLLVILGDRFEILTAAQVAMISRIPIAHLHGGEITEGLIDEAIRHAVTKMSHLHFVATQDYAKRVMQMGENKKFVFNYGAPGLDYIHSVKLLSKAELEEKLEFKFQKINFLITYHPVTLITLEELEIAVDNFLLALSEFKDIGIIFTKPNVDVSGLYIIEKIEKFICTRQNCKLYDSLGQLNYFSLLKVVDIMIGNSSSGLIEAPVFNVPVINIGLRQSGRSKGPSIIDCEDSPESIKKAIRKGLAPDFRNSLRSAMSPYGIGGNNSLRIKECLKNVNLEGILIKKFYSVTEEENSND